MRKTIHDPTHANTKGASASKNYIIFRTIFQHFYKVKCEIVTAPTQSSTVSILVPDPFAADDALTFFCAKSSMWELVLLVSCD